LRRHAASPVRARSPALDSKPRDRIDLVLPFVVIARDSF